MWGGALAWTVPAPGEKSITRRHPLTDARLRAPAAARNRDPILAALRPHLRGAVLEVASGSGEHVAHLAAALPAVIFQPSDPRPEGRASIDAWVASQGLANVRPALALDATGTWTITGMDAVLCINMIHIAPWAATIGLMRNAGAALRPGGLLFLYGPYRRAGAHTAPSNAAFDADLKSRNPDWGVRDLEQVEATAAAAGLALEEVAPMPANNFSVLFRKSA